MKNFWIILSGKQGAWPNYREVYQTKQEAVDAVSILYDLPPYGGAINSLKNKHNVEVEDNLIELFHYTEKELDQ